MVGLTSNDDQRFVFFDAAGTILGSAPGPYLGSDSIPDDLRMRASITAQHMCAPPDGGRFVVYYYPVSRVEIRDSMGVLTAIAEAPYPVEPEFARHEETNQLQFRIGTLNYMSCAPTNAHLYLLYSGRRFGDGQEGPPTSGREIHVFDWSGRFKGRIILSQPVRGIGMANDEEFGIGLSEETAAVLQWRMQKR
jgi:hypothetical protein